MWLYCARLDDPETYRYCWRGMPGEWAQEPWTYAILSSGQSMWHPPRARATAHFWVEYLEDQGCSSSIRTQLNHQLQRWFPLATARVPHPAKAWVWGAKGKENECWRGGWTKSLLSPSLQLGRLWSGWFIQGSSDGLGPQPHLAELTSPPPTPVSWVLWDTWPAGRGRAGPSLPLPFHLASLSGQPWSSGQEHGGTGEALGLPAGLDPQHLTSTDMQVTHRPTITHRGLPACSTSWRGLKTCRLILPLVGGHTHACTDTRRHRVHGKAGQSSFSHQALQAG